MKTLFILLKLHDTQSTLFCILLMKMKRPKFTFCLFWDALQGWRKHARNKSIFAASVTLIKSFDSLLAVGQVTWTLELASPELSIVKDSDFMYMHPNLVNRDIPACHYSIPYCFLFSLYSSKVISGEKVWQEKRKTKGKNYLRGERVWLSHLSWLIGQTQISNWPITF